MHKYKIKDIKLHGYHGLYEEEKENGQNFFITISYEVKNSNDIKDEIQYVVDYSMIIKHTKFIFKSKRYVLMENLSKDIYDYLTSKFPVINLSIEVKKINPTLNDEVEYISTIYNG